MFLCVELSINERNFRSSCRVTQLLGRTLLIVWISILLIKRKFLSPVAVVLALYYTVLKLMPTPLANTSRIHTNLKSFKHFHQLKQKCLCKPQVNVCAANNDIYSHKSHAIKLKKTAKPNEFLHRIHALKNKAKDTFCVADWRED